MLKKTTLRDKRDSFGQSSVEITCGIVIFIPLILLAIDLTTIYSGYSLNMKVCADAARAASNGPPDALVRGAPKLRAEATIRNLYAEDADKNREQNKMMHVHPDCVATENLTGSMPDPKLGGPIDGQVTIETTLDVKPPFLIKQFINPKGITLTARQTYPYTYNIPAAPNATE